jgi:3'-phosphoadenosine 5'-phosphosulfate sulfotransferase (PAPS reductase)/FAD synthetase
MPVYSAMSGSYPSTTDNDINSERSGRWWWKEVETRECGLHLKDGRFVRAGA